MTKEKKYMLPNTNLLDLTLYQYGMEEYLPGQMYDNMIRNHYLLHFILHGKGSYRSEGLMYTLKAGQAFLIPPKIRVSYSADEKDPWTCAWVEFDGLKAAEYLKRAGLGPESVVYTPRFKEIKGTPAAPERLLHILEHHGDTTLYLVSQLYLLLDSLIKYSKKEAEKHPGTLRDFYMKEAVHYIEEHYSEDISVEDLAASCNLNRTYFSKLFKDSLKITPQEFLIKYRMTQACELLSKSNLPIGGVAASVGYQNALHFSRAFRKIYGTSPRSWRGQNRI